MHFESLLLLVAVGTLCFLVAWPIAKASTFYRTLLAGMDKDRTAMVDGLRGWLALGVLLTHAACMHSHFSNGTWDSSRAWIYGQTGPVGVSLFFMVTAFLFWGRVLRTQGGLNVQAFFRSRVRRIVPMYLASVLIVLLVVAFASEFRLHESPVALAKQVRAWLAFGFLPYGDINGVQAHYINGVYWTLAFEWSFYLALPLLASYARSWRFGALLALAAILCGSKIVLCFLFGALAAWIVERNVIPFKLDKHWLTPLPIAALLLTFTYDEIFALMPATLLFIFFLFLVKDNSLFGFLATSTAKFLGTISYSIYLLHCIVVYVAVAVAHQYVPIGSMPMGAYTMIIVAAALLTVFASTVTYRFVEHPFLANPRQQMPVSAAETNGHPIGTPAVTFWRRGSFQTRSP